MSKALLLALFVLFGSFPGRAAGQTTGGRNQTLTNINNQKNPISAARPSSIASTELNAEAKKFYLEGLKLAEAEQFPEAAENFRQAVGLDSEYVDAYSALGWMYFKMREWQKATENLRRAISLRAKQREKRQSLHQQPAMQARSAFDTLEKTNVIASQTTVPQDKNANIAVVKPVQPGPTTMPAERRQETGVTLKPEAKRELKQPATKANTAVLKPVQPGPTTVPTQRQQETGAALKPARTEPELKPAANANIAVVKPVQPGPTTMPAERRQETGVTLKPEAKRELKQPATKANTAVLKPVQPGPTTVPTQRQQETWAALKPARTEPELKPAANANTGVVKPVQPRPTTMPAERRQETGVTLKPEAKLELKQPATKANTAGVKTLQPQSETRNANTSAAVKQPVANADEVGVKSLLLQSEGTADLKEAVARAADQRQEAVGVRASMQLTPSSQPLETRSPSSPSAAAANDDLSLTKIYRVGPNDVLDVRLNDSNPASSTLFTVTPSGLIEYPVLNEPLLVTDLTVEEIGTKIEDELKKRALVENAKVNVWVRDYASHSILVSGLVKDSGTKFLRREAIPLYVVVADAQPVPEAARVTLVRNEQHKIYEIDLTQAADMNLLVRQGDVITLQPNVTQFVYIGGEVKNPGEKTFRRGLTLTQLIITAGGLTAKGRVVEIDRDDGRGFLVGSHFSLKDIESGKAADPLLKPGDRVMILRENR